MLAGGGAVGDGCRDPGGRRRQRDEPPGPSRSGGESRHAAGRPNPAPAADGRLEIRAVAAATGKPIEGAAVAWRLRINHGRYQDDEESTTNGDGRAVLEWPGGATVNGLEVTVRKAGFVPYFIQLG